MCFRDYLYTSLCRIGENVGQSHLRTGMQMYFRLFKIYSMARFRHQQSNQNRKRLRNTESHIGNTYQVSRSSLRPDRHATNFDFHSCIFYRTCVNLPCKAKF